MPSLFDIREYGALPDGETINTAALQQAIDACHRAGGGRVECGPGRWRTGCVELKSNVELHLAPGCRIVGSPNMEDYAPLAAEGFHAAHAPEHSAHSLLRAVGAENIALTGPGTIDGAGLSFYDPRGVAGAGKLDKPDDPRPRIGMFYRCRNLRIQDVGFVDSACWTLWLMQCEGVGIHRVRIEGNRRMRNGDGIDIDACRDVVVSDCRMDTEDDCIAVRAIRHLYDEPAVCERITVTNCVLKTSCQGVRVGCPGDGAIRDIAFSNLVIESANNGILFEYPRRYLPPDGRAGAEVSDISFSNVVVRCRKWPVRIAVEEGIALRRLAGLSFSGFSIHSGGPCVVQGSPETIVRDVRFSDVRIETSGGDAVLCRHCEGVDLVHVKLSNRAEGA